MAKKTRIKESDGNSNPAWEKNSQTLPTPKTKEKIKPKKNNKI